MSQLLTVMGELANTHTREAVARIVIERGFAAVGASYGAMWLLDGESRLELLATTDLPRGSIERWTSIPLDLDAPLPCAVRTGEPVILESLADYERRFPASYARIASTISSASAAYAHLPLTASGRPVGGLAATYERAADLDASERTFLAILARQCGEALIRVRAEAEVEAALVEARRAHALAEEATRAREEILSVVSHDLRNPLGTIVMGASALVNITDASDADPKNVRVRVVAERIQRQAERMTRLIEDLVDFAGIQAGKLAIVRRACAPAALVAQAAELFGPLATERGIGFDIQVAGWLPAIECDVERGLQVFSNLIGNAVKVTPRNGRVEIGARLEEDVVFFVRDTGPGIDADELPRLFERYWRSKKTSYKGAGLGLSIAKGIVDAHAGRIWATTSPETGTTFAFTLTPRAGLH